MAVTEQQLPGGLPPGRLIAPDPRYAWPGTDLPADPLLWVSDEPLSPAEAGRRWGELYERRRATGLWPLLLGALPDNGEEPPRPWHNGQVQPTSSAAADEVDLAQLGAEGWEELRQYAQLPYPEWPGPAPASPDRSADPDACALAVTSSAEGVSALFSATGPGPYLGLTDAADSAGAILACGWQPEIGPDAVAAMVRTWDRRFGARLCALESQSLGLSVAWPPRTPDHARQIAAEHLAFCPDLAEAADFDTYAAALVDARVWALGWL